MQSEHGLRDPSGGVCGQLLWGWCACMWMCVRACLWSEWSVPAARVGFAHHMSAAGEACNPTSRYWIDWECKTSYWRDPYCIIMDIFSINGPLSWSAGEDIGDVWVCMSADYFCLYCSVWFAGCIHIYVLYTCVCACTSWEYMVMLLAGGIWMHEAAAALPLLGYWVQQPLTGFIKVILNIYNHHECRKNPGKVYIWVFPNFGRLWIISQTWSCLLGGFGCFPKHDLFSWEWGK